MLNQYINYIQNHKPDAIAILRGNKDHNNLWGKTLFYQVTNGVIVATEVTRLPTSGTSPFNVFAYHIHFGVSCTGNSEDLFADALAHYNPTNKPHPQHAGDLPPLFANNGYAFSVVLTNRFRLRDVLNKTLIIHNNPDDLTTQPSGNSGKKIACGIISRFS